MLQLAAPLHSSQVHATWSCNLCPSPWPPLPLRPAPLCHYLGRSPNLWYNVGVAAAGL